MGKRDMRGAEVIDHAAWCSDCNELKHPDDTRGDKCECGGELKRLPVTRKAVLDAAQTRPYEHDDVRIDGSRLSRGDNGTMVLAWVWVPDDCLGIEPRGAGEPR